MSTYIHNSADLKALQDGEEKQSCDVYCYKISAQYESSLNVRDDGGCNPPYVLCGLMSIHVYNNG